jgi:hypothetical protein
MPPTSPRGAIAFAAFVVACVAVVTLTPVRDWVAPLGHLERPPWIDAARETAYDALAHALDTARSLRESSLPRARAVHAAVQEGYRRGKFGLLDLFDARRFLLQVQLEYINALRSVWTANADLVRLTSPGSIPGSRNRRATTPP